jgi:AraC-like DNA-binding protein
VRSTARRRLLPDSYPSLTITWDDLAVRRILRHRLVVGGVALAFAAGGGAAYAATQSSSNPRQAFVNDVAKRLNVSPQRLTSAIKAAEIDRLNAAVKDRRLTRAQANAIRHAIETKGPPFVGSGPGPVLPPGPMGGPPFFGGPPPFELARPFAAAASYLGLSESQLFKDLHSGRALAQIAKARGKSVSGLERAITATIKSRLDRTVTAGRLTKPQEQQILKGLSIKLHDLINGTPTVLGPGPPPSLGPGRHLGPIPRAHLSMVPPF